jgi:hypothetical protein
MSMRKLAEDIERARSAFLETLSGIDDVAVRSPIGEGRWSPLEYLEHLVRAEEATLWRMFKAVEDSRKAGDVLTSRTPHESIEEIVDRTWGGDVPAPPLAIPKLGGSVSYWSTRLARNADLVSAFGDFMTLGELESVAYPHPISGAFTMRQGLEFIRFHLDRHRAHLLDAGLGPL